VQALYDLTRTIDPTRPVVGNDGWESSDTDIVGIHDYESDPSRLLARYGGEGATDGIARLLPDDWPGGRALTLEGYPHEGQPLMLTEFGGITMRGEHSDAEGGWGYSVTADADGLRRSYEALLDAVNRIPGLSGFCYTQFTDTFQEGNGLFYADRTPKFDLDAMRAATMGRRGRPHEVEVVHL
jgi:hypothetical protein